MPDRFLRSGFFHPASLPRQEHNPRIRENRRNSNRVVSDRLPMTNHRVLFRRDCCNWRRAFLVGFVVTLPFILLNHL